MALMYCSECGREISDSASKCIHCGYRLKREDKKAFLIYIAIILQLIVIVVALVHPQIYKYRVFGGRISSNILLNLSDNTLEFEFDAATVVVSYLAFFSLFISLGMYIMRLIRPELFSGCWFAPFIGFALLTLQIYLLGHKDIDVTFIRQQDSAVCKAGSGWTILVVSMIVISALGLFASSHLSLLTGKERDQQ